MTEIVVLVRCNKLCQQRVLAKLSEQSNCRGEEPSSLHIQCSEKKLIRGPDYKKITFLQITTAIVDCEFVPKSRVYLSEIAWNNF